MDGVALFMLVFGVVCVGLGIAIRGVYDALIEEYRLQRALRLVRAHKKRVGPKTHPRGS